MQELLKQMRVRFPHARPGNIEETSKERRLPPQKTQSFKERKKVQNWFQRQFSKDMSTDYEFGDIEHATAVAAAAYAINSLESGNPNQEKSVGGPETALTKNKSKKDVTISIQETGKVSRKLSGLISGESSKRNQEVDVADGKIPEKITGFSPRVKRALTFADENSNIIGSEKPVSPLPKPAMPSVIKPLSAAQKPAIRPTETRRQSSTKPRVGETMADAWEKSEMIRIKKRYEKLNSTIQSWAEKKKTKARRKLDRKESEMERRRAKTLEHYSIEMKRIEEIAGGTKAKAEERRRKEEVKAKEKANIIRSTGKVPVSCLCF